MPGGPQATSSLAAELRRRRRSARLSQEQLAERSGLSVRAIRDLETGRVRSPRKTSLAMLAGALGIDAAELGATPPARPAPVTHDGATATGLRPPPAPAVGVIGRDGLLDRVYGLLRPGAQLCLCGAPGVGKSTVAAALAHHLPEAFEAVVWLDLRGFSRPRPVIDALRSLINAVDHDAHVSIDDRRLLELHWARVLGEHRVLVILDNAADEEALRPLLPPSETAAVVITARRPMTVVEPSHIVVVEPLPPAAGVELFQAWVGAARADATTSEVAQIVTACDGLPLALQVAAARLNSRPAWTVADLATRLAPVSGRLDQLRLGGLDVRATLRSAYDALPEEQRSWLRCLAAPGAAEVPGWLAAALFDQDETTAALSCDALVDAGLLLSRGGSGGGAGEVFALHDLVRIMAAEQAWSAAHRQETVAAVERAVTAVRRLAAPLEQALIDQWASPAGAEWANSPARLPVAPGAATEPARRAALDILDRDADAVSAVVDTAVQRLDPDTAVTALLAYAAYCYMRSRFTDWMLSHEALLTRTRDDDGEPTLRAFVLFSLGTAYFALGDGARAYAVLERAVAFGERSGDAELARSARIGALLTLAYRRDDSDVDRATVAARADAEFDAARKAGARWASVVSALALARLRTIAGAPEDAIALIEQVRADDLPPWVQARVALRAGEVYLELGTPDALDRATAEINAAYQFFAGNDSPTWTAACLHIVSQVEARRGRHEQALRLLARAETTFARLGNRRSANLVRVTAAQCRLKLGDVANARTALDTARTAFLLLDDRHGLTLVEQTMAELKQAVGPD